MSIKWCLKETDERLRFLVEKLDNGDPIDDDELASLIEFYEPLENSLRVVGERYHFAWWHAWGRLQTLKGFEEARKERKRKRGL